MTDTKERQTTRKYGRLTLDLDPDVHAEIKVAAARARTTMREYITSSVLRRMEREQETLKAS